MFFTKIKVTHMNNMNMYNIKDQRHLFNEGKSLFFAIKYGTCAPLWPWRSVTTQGKSIWLVHSSIIRKLHRDLWRACFDSSKNFEYNNVLHYMFTIVIKFKIIRRMLRRQYRFHSFDIVSECLSSTYGAMHQRCFAAAKTSFICVCV